MKQERDREEKINIKKKTKREQILLLLTVTVLQWCTVSVVVVVVVRSSSSIIFIVVVDSPPSSSRSTTQISPPKEANCLQRDYPEKKIDEAVSPTSHRNTSAPYYPFKTIVSHPIISIVASKPLHRPSNFDE